MKGRKVQSQQMHGRAFAFLTAHLGMFPKDSVAEVLHAELGQVVETLSAYSSSHIGGYGATRTSRNVRSAARRSLKTQLELMVTTPRVLNLEKFRMPRNRADRAYIDAGRNFSDCALPLEKEFIQQGMPPGFIENLKEAVTQLEKAITSQAASLAGRLGARREFEKTLKQGLTLLQRLDVLVLNTMADNPTVMAAWEVARRLDPAARTARSVPEEKQETADPPAQQAIGGTA